jgi:hypothetical protein
VVTYANAVFASGNVTSMLRPWNTTYRTMTPAEIFAIYAKATEPANLLLCETQSLWARNYYTVRYSLNSSKRDEILGDNVTGGEYAFNYQTYTVGTNNFLIPKISEYFVRSSVNANIGFPYVMVPLLTAEEVLFNRAEAYVYLNNVNAALQDLNTYASTRIVGYKVSDHNIDEAKLQAYYRSNNTPQNALNAVLDFKRAEYVHEGMRWFDMLRYHIPVTHTTVEGQTMTLGANSLQRVFQLPESVKQSGMPLNPR